MNNIAQFWFVAAIITIIIFYLLWSSARRGAFIARSRKGASDALYEGQIAELERNILSGQIGEDAAIAMRQEILRAHSRAIRRGEDGDISEGPSFALWGIIGAAIIGALVAYNQFGAPGYPDFGLAKRAEIENPSQDRMMKILAENDALVPAPILDAETQNILDQLNQAISNHPDVPEGYYHLRVLHYGTGNFREAYLAQARYIDLIGIEATSEDYAILAETMVLSVNGYVSPEARTAIDKALELNPQNDAAKFYKGLSLQQDNKLDAAKTVFMDLRKRNTDNATWISEIDNQIAAIERKMAPTKAPTAADIENAAELSVEERAEMIGGMVDGLQNRLAQSGGTPEEWARLIGALRVLGRNDEASAILDEALQKFPDNTAIKALSQ